MNHNPRKFEEKIALNKQKQAEQDKQFEDIIRDVSNIRDNEVGIFVHTIQYTIHVYILYTIYINSSTSLLVAKRLFTTKLHNNKFDSNSNNSNSNTSLN